MCACASAHTHTQTFGAHKIYIISENVWWKCRLTKFHNNSNNNNKNGTVKKWQVKWIGNYYGMFLLTNKIGLILLENHEFFSKVSQILFLIAIASRWIFLALGLFMIANDANTMAVGLRKFVLFIHFINLLNRFKQASAICEGKRRNNHIFHFKSFAFTILWFLAPYRHKEIAVLHVHANTHSHTDKYSHSYTLYCLFRSVHVCA